MEDLPGVYDTETTRDSVRMHFDPELTNEQQFYEAVKIMGFNARDFVVASDNRPTCLYCDGDDAGCRKPPFRSRPRLRTAVLQSREAGRLSRQ